MKDVQQLLLVMLHAIEMTASKISYSDPTTSAALNDIAENVRRGFDQMMQQHVNDVLFGDGPVARLHKKVSNADGKVGNHIEVVDQHNRLTYSDVVTCLQKYLSTTVTHFEHGGVAEPQFERLPGNLDFCSFDDLSGLYVNASGYSNKNQIVLSISNGHGLYSHVVVTLETQRRSVNVHIHSYHPIEQQWVTHDILQLIDKNQFERALIHALKQNVQFDVLWLTRSWRCTNSISNRHKS